MDEGDASTEEAVAGWDQARDEEVKLATTHIEQPCALETEARNLVACLDQLLSWPTDYGRYARNKTIAAAIVGSRRLGRVSGLQVARIRDQEPVHCVGLSAESRSACSPKNPPSRTADANAAPSSNPSAPSRASWANSCSSPSSNSRSIIARTLAATRAWNCVRPSTWGTTSSRRNARTEAASSSVVGRLAVAAIPGIDDELAPLQRLSIHAREHRRQIEKSAASLPRSDTPTSTRSRAVSRSDQTLLRYAGYDNQRGFAIRGASQGDYDNTVSHRPHGRQHRRHPRHRRLAIPRPRYQLPARTIQRDPSARGGTTSQAGPAQVAGTNVNDNSPTPAGERGANTPRCSGPNQWYGKVSRDKLVTATARAERQPHRHETPMRQRAEAPSTETRATTRLPPSSVPTSVCARLRCSLRRWMSSSRSR